MRYFRLNYQNKQYYKKLTAPGDKLAQLSLRGWPQLVLGLQIMMMYIIISILCSVFDRKQNILCSSKKEQQNAEKGNLFLFLLTKQKQGLVLVLHFVVLFFNKKQNTDNDDESSSSAFCVLWYTEYSLFFEKRTTEKDKDLSLYPSFLFKSPSVP